MTRRLLVRATGNARPGQLAAFGQALADTGARLLDINQSVTFDIVTLEALIAVDENSDLSWGCDNTQALDQRIEKAWQEAGDQTGLELQAIEVDDAAFARWSEHVGSPRIIMTLLAPRMPVSILAQIGQLTSQWGLTVELVHRLSGRESLHGDAPENGACIECWLRGEAMDIEGLRKASLAIGAELGVDIALQEDSIWRRHRRLICFDMDSTLIKAEVIDELARRHGVFDEVAAITERAMRGEIDFQQSFRERMSMLNGLSESVLADVAENLELMDGLERLMTQLKRLGYRTAILSGGFTYFAHYLQKRLGFDEVHANELVIANGVVTGEVSEPIVDADRKAQLLKEIAQRQGIALEQTIAVGDGANDLKMLATAGLGIAFRAKPLVREQARQSISRLGLDSVLYLLGYREQDLY